MKMVSTQNHSAELAMLCSPISEWGSHGKKLASFSAVPIIGSAIFQGRMVARIVMILCWFATASLAQGFRIIGVVMDSAGKGVPGAEVLLGSVNQKVLTDAQGKFSIGSTVGDVDRSLISSSAFRLFLQNSELWIESSTSGQVDVAVYSLNGKMVIKTSKMMDPGRHLLANSMMPNANYVCLVNGSHGQSIHFLATMATERAIGLGNSEPMMASRVGAGGFDGVLQVKKEGYLDYLIRVKRVDTSRVDVSLIRSAGTVKDVDGNIYQSVRIGGQVWTTGNLKVTRFNDGTPIPQVTDANDWSKLKTPAFCYNYNKVENGKNGLLYNWYAASSGRIAPKGWRVPTHEEQLVLREYLLANGKKFNYDGSTGFNRIGKSMSARTDWSYKTTNENGKPVPDTVGMVGNNLHTNNSTGFSALPVGSRWHDGSFHALTWSLYMWSSSAYQSGWEGWHTSIHTFGADHGFNHHDKRMGFSIRLIRE